MSLQDAVNLLVSAGCQVAVKQFEYLQVTTVTEEGIEVGAALMFGKDGALTCQCTGPGAGSFFTEVLGPEVEVQDHT